jgi:hypothetical protein
LAIPSRLLGQETADRDLICTASATVAAPSTLNVLRLQYRVGDPRLYDNLVELLRSLRFVPVSRNASAEGTPPAPQADDACTIDVKRHFYRVVFAATDLAGETTLANILVHSTNDPPGVNLPGLWGRDRPLYDLFLADDEYSRLDAVYTSTPQSNPLAAAAGAFAQNALGKLVVPGSTLVTLAAAKASADATPVEIRTIRAAMYAVRLPHKRAEIAVKDHHVVAHPLAALANRALTIVDEVSPPTAGEGSHGAPHAVCHAVFARQLHKALSTVLATPPCGLNMLDRSTCYKDAKVAIEDAFKSSTCTTPAAHDVGRRFVALVGGDPKVVSRDSKLANAPKDRFSFGLGTSYVTSKNLDNPRVKIQNGKIAPDPLSRALTLAFVNYAPIAYDGRSARMQLGEYLRAFGGVTLTPAFGPAAGVSVALTRSLGLNVGHAWMLIDVPKPTETLYLEPVDALSPFEVGTERAWFVGASFNFKP